MIWNKNSMENKAKRAKKVLDILGVKAESQKQIMETIAMEILATEFEMQDKYSKAHFVRTQGDSMNQVREMLVQEGVLTRKKLEGGKKDGVM